MSLTTDEFNRYLTRIQMNKLMIPSATLHTLQQIHKAHLTTIPFENLDIHTKNPIYLDKDSLIKKMIDNKRGGYCYESNELLALALEYLGFTVHRLVARALFPEQRTRGHKILIVEFKDEYWLTDVAFGGNSIYQPLKLPCHQANMTYDMQNDDEYMLVLGLDKYRINTYCLKMKMNNTWVDLYAFNLFETLAIDFMILNHAMSTYFDSPFVKQRICAIYTEQGRKLLLDNVFKIRNGSKNIEKYLTNHEYIDVLENEFGIYLSPAERQVLMQE